MKCHLHIGTEKTATTTIQSFFHLNRDILQENSFYYTSTLGKENNRALPVLAYGNKRRDDFTKERGLKNPMLLRRFQQNAVKKLKEELGQLPSSTEVIFSSEHIQSRLTKPFEIRRLKAILTNLGFKDFSIIIYLRRPADIANSLFSTAIKAGSTSLVPPLPDAVDAPYYYNVCNHKETILKYGDVFGMDNLKVRLFDREEFFNKEITQDILKTIGVPTNIKFLSPSNQNESLTNLGVHLLKHINTSVPKWVDNKKNPLRAGIVEYLQAFLNDGKYHMSSDTYQAYDKEFAESNDWVRSNFFPDRKTLFSNKIPNQSESSFSEEDFIHISNLISNVWNLKQAEILRSAEK